MSFRYSWFLIAFALVPAVAPAQWLGRPIPGTPRTADGKPNLAAPAPRLADGKPDLSGTWESESEGGNRAGVSAAGPPNKYFSNVLADFKTPESIMQPATLAQYNKSVKAEFADSPLAHCQPAGMPLADAMTNPYKLVQTPGLIMMMYERDTTFRQIYTDGRSLPADPQPTWLGYSVGRWDGDTLVVETNGVTDRAWLDARGHTHTEGLHITERFHRVNFGKMEVAITIDDPKAYTKPFSYTLVQNLFPDSDVLEFFCSDDEKDVNHYRGKQVPREAGTAGSRRPRAFARAVPPGRPRAAKSGWLRCFRALFCLAGRANGYA